MQNPWSFGRDVVAQALGTVIGGAVLLLIGKLSGVIGGVDWGEVGKVAGLLAIPIAGGVFYLLWELRQQREQEASRRAMVSNMLDNMDQDEAVAINAYTDKARWNNLPADEKKRFEDVLLRMLTRHL